MTRDVSREEWLASFIHKPALEVGEAMLRYAMQQPTPVTQVAAMIELIEMRDTAVRADAMDDAIEVCEQSIMSRSLRELLAKRIRAMANDNARGTT